MKNYNLNWSEYFQLDEKSPSGLVRIKDYHNNIIEPNIVGTKQFQKNGDAMGWAVRFKGKNYYVHRIIWVLKNGDISDKLVIDHLDGNPFNNSINNLSLKLQKDNTRNLRKYHTNKTGVTGVYLMNNTSGTSFYVASWSDKHGKRKTKCFSVKKFGDEAAKLLAILYREQEIIKLISTGAGYTPRHGT